MKRVKKLTKGNFTSIVIILVIGIIVGMVIAGATVYAATTITGSTVTYSNSSSGLSSTTVQEAIDEIYEKSKTHCPDGYECTKLYYAFGRPTTSSTTDYTTLGYNYFVRLKGTGELGACTIRNEKSFCINSNNFDNSKAKLIEEFGKDACNVDSSGVGCSDSDSGCFAYSNGSVGCHGASAHSYCYVDSDGSADCYD